MADISIFIGIITQLITGGAPPCTILGMVFHENADDLRSVTMAEERAMQLTSQPGSVGVFFPEPLIFRVSSKNSE